MATVLTNVAPTGIVRSVFSWGPLFQGTKRSRLRLWDLFCSFLLVKNFIIMRSKTIPITDPVIAFVTWNKATIGGAEVLISKNLDDYFKN